MVANWDRMPTLAQAVEMASRPHGYPGLGLYKGVTCRRMTPGPSPVKSRVKKNQWDVTGIHMMMLSYA